MTADNWKIEGSYFETCNCEAACPCNFGGPPTEGECTVLVAWHIEDGSFDETRLDGLNVCMVAHAPGHMLQTKWKVALYLDDRADADQANALMQIFSGQAGGPIQEVSTFVGEVAGVRHVPIEYQAEGRRRGVRVAGLGRAQIEAIEGGGGGDTTISNPPLNLAPGAPLVVARSTECRYADFGMTLEVSSRNGFYAPFTYRP